uniref:alcohol dehydrogenase (NADP(+)) n=1 Tax=Phallusia mammillata TaxID=59560 RepID=A0A6F9D6C9_9ASCI|nr:aldose reductase-like [Phallusia mammillata]
MSNLAPLKTLCNGTTLPMLGLGTYRALGSEVYEAVKHGLKIGYRHIDTAYYYSNEDHVGKAVLDAIDELKIARDDIRVVTKLPNTCNRPSLVIPALKQSLENLNLPFVDLYLIHTPVCRTPMYEEKVSPEGKNDKDGKPMFDDIEPKEIWKEMEKCVEMGLTKSIGVSNFNSQQIQQIVDNCKIKPVTNQVEGHPYLQQDHLREFCAKHDIVLTTYRPLGGRLKPHDPDILNDKFIKELATKYGKTSAQILLRWQIEKGHIVLAKSANPKRMEDNLQIFDFSISAEDMEKMRSLEVGHRFCPYTDSKPSPQFPLHLSF